MSTLIAPVFSVHDLNTFARENRLPPGKQHYAITKRTSDRQYLTEEEIVHDAGVTELRWPESSKLQAALQVQADALNQESFDEHVRGRKFTRYWTNSYITTDQVEAERLADLDHTPSDKMRVHSDLEILYSNGSFILWSDGRTSGTIGLRLPAGGSVSPAAATLIRHTRLQKAWRTDDAWRKLASVQSLARETVAQLKDSWRGIGAHGSDEYTLDRLTTDTGLELYELSQVGGAMGEDGDTWEYYYLYDNEYEARTEYRKETMTVLAEVINQAARYIEQDMWGSVARAWPLEAAHAKEHFDIELPLQAEMAEALQQQEAYDVQFADLDDVIETWEAQSRDDLAVQRPEVDAHGWAMYLKGFAKAL